MNPYVQWLLAQVELAGSKFEPMGWLYEGPRLVGQCVYCGGPCTGATTNCDWRVYAEGTSK